MTDSNHPTRPENPAPEEKAEYWLVERGASSNIGWGHDSNQEGFFSVLCFGEIEPGDELATCKMADATGDPRHQNTGHPCTLRKPLPGERVEAIARRKLSPDDVLTSYADRMSVRTKDAAPTIADAVLQHLEGEVQIPPPSPVPQLEAEHLQHRAGSTLPPSRSSYESSTARARSELSIGDVYRLVKGQIDDLKKVVADQKSGEQARVDEIMVGVGEIMREVRAGTRELEASRKMHERNYEMLRAQLRSLDGAHSGLVERLDAVEPELARVGKIADESVSRLDEIEEQIRELLARPQQH